jgi:hypothetical protein
MWNRNGNLIAFLAMTFAILGLLGLFASIVAPIPLERALARDAALDEAAAAALGPNPQAAIEALRPRLAESADALLPVQPDLADRIARERNAMHARFLAEAANTASHLRLMIGIVTVICALFGAALLAIAARAT